MALAGAKLDAHVARARGLRFDVEVVLADLQPGFARGRAHAHARHPTRVRLGGAGPELSVEGLAWLLFGVAANGMAWILVATRAAVRSADFACLREE